MVQEEIDWWGIEAGASRTVRQDDKDEESNTTPPYDGPFSIVVTQVASSSSLSGQMKFGRGRWCFGVRFTHREEFNFQMAPH